MNTKTDKRLDIQAYERQVSTAIKEHNKRAEFFTKGIKLTDRAFKTYMRKARKDPEKFAETALMYRFFRSLLIQTGLMDRRLTDVNIRLFGVEALQDVNEFSVETLQKVTLDMGKLLYEDTPKWGIWVNKRLRELTRENRSRVLVKMHAKVLREKRSFDRQLAEVQPAIEWYRDLQSHTPETTRD